MFTGIIETTGEIRKIEKNGDNLIFWIYSPISAELKPDQSISHNGVCLTVEAIDGDMHRVTTIPETLAKTTLKNWKSKDIINLERCLKVDGRLDGHIVQGHVDSTAVLVAKKELAGSIELSFSYEHEFASFLIEKGSISVNGISLTLFDVTDNRFSVAIIPYTFDHTNLRSIDINESVNLEFDIVGKYMNRIFSLTKPIK
jgi:riboflavin synthase